MTLEPLLKRGRGRPPKNPQEDVYVGQEAKTRLNRRLVWEKKIEQVGLSNVMDAIRLLMAKAKEGDFPSLKLFLELFLPPYLKDKSAFFDKPVVLQEAKDFETVSDQVMTLAGKGQVGLKDAEKMMNIIEGRRKCFEMNKLSQDVEKLKQFSGNS